MGRVIQTWRDPYDSGWSTCRRKEVEFMPGLTVLVGCNGSGKTTMLNNIKTKLKKEDIPVFSFDNVANGGSKTVEEALFDGDISLSATALCCSEGENISLSLGKCVAKWRKFLLTGDNGDRINRLAEVISRINKGENDQNKQKISNERWILCKVRTLATLVVR